LVRSPSDANQQPPRGRGRGAALGRLHRRGPGAPRRRARHPREGRWPGRRQRRAPDPALGRGGL